MKTYRGQRLTFPCTMKYGSKSIEHTALVTKDEGADLDPRLDLWNHSPSGFEWGYGGSGPAQLALAILADVMQEDQVASALHQYFKGDLIAQLDQNDDWIITENAVREWLLQNQPLVDKVRGRYTEESE